MPFLQTKGRSLHLQVCLTPLIISNFDVFQDPLSYRSIFPSFKPTSMKLVFTWKLLLLKNNVRNFLFCLPLLKRLIFGILLAPLCLIYAKIEAMGQNY